MELHLLALDSPEHSAFSFTDVAQEVSWPFSEDPTHVEKKTLGCPAGVRGLTVSPGDTAGRLGDGRVGTFVTEYFLWIVNKGLCYTERLI